MRALSIRQPWAWAILHAGKRHENRSWSTSYRGPLLIHASKRWRPEEIVDTFYEVRRMAKDCGLDLVSAAPPVTAQSLRLESGGIVGIAEIVDCVTTSDSPWFVGPRALVLANVRPLPFLPCPGSLGLFTVNERMEAAVRGIQHGVCACQSELDDPGPWHLPTCPWSDPAYDSGGFP